MKEDMNTTLMNDIRITENMIRRSRGKRRTGTHGKGRIVSAVIKNDGITQSQLAKKLEIRPQSLTRVLSELEGKGFITRERDVKDRRVISVHITEEGLVRHREMDAQRRERAGAIFGCLNEEEKQQLHILLNKVMSTNNGKEDA